MNNINNNPLNETLENIRVVLEFDFPMPGIEFDGYTTDRWLPDEIRKSLVESGLPGRGLVLGVEAFERNRIHKIRKGVFEDSALANLQEMLDCNVAERVKVDDPEVLAAFRFTTPAMVFADMAGAHVRLHARTTVEKGKAEVYAALDGKRLRAASIFLRKNEGFAGAHVRVNDAVVRVTADENGNWQVSRICRRNATVVTQPIASGDMKSNPAIAGKFGDAVLAALRSAAGYVDRYCIYRNEPVDQGGLATILN